MGHRAHISRSARASDFGHPAAGRQAGAQPLSRDIGFAARLHLVKWRVTKDSPKLHISEPIRTGGAALMEARALLEAGACEVWVERPDGSRLEADGTVRKN